MSIYSDDSVRGHASPYGCLGTSWTAAGQVSLWASRLYPLLPSDTEGSSDIGSGLAAVSLDFLSAVPESLLTVRGSVPSPVSADRHRH